MADTDPLTAALEEIRARAARAAAREGDAAIWLGEMALVASDDVPRLLALAAALLDGHEPLPLYAPASHGDGHDGPSACGHDPDHRAHFESDNGEWLCEEAPGGVECEKCREELIDTTDADWPCGVYTTAARALLGEGGADVQAH